MFSEINKDGYYSETYHKILVTLHLKQHIYEAM